MKQPQQVAEGADRTEKAPLKKAPGQNNDHHKAAGKQADLKPRQHWRNCDRRAEDSYRQFFLDAGYSDVQIMLADGRIPCAVAVMKRKKEAVEQ